MVDSSWFASSSEDSTARVWTREGEARYVLQGHSGGVQQIALSHDKNYIATGGADSTLRVWGREGRSIQEYMTNGMVQDLAFSPNGRNMLLITQSEEQPIGIWSVQGGVQRQWGYGPEEITSASYSADGNLGLFASWDNQVYITDFSGYPIQTLSHPTYVSEAQFIAKPGWGLSLCDGKAFIWKRIRRPLEHMIRAEATR